MLQLFWQSYVQPRETMRQVLRFNFPVNLLFWAALAMCCAIAAIEGVFVQIASPESDLANITAGPIRLAALQFGITILTAVVIDRVGRLFGGEIDFQQALTVAVWYTAVALLPNIAVLFLQAIGHPMAIVVQLAAAFWMVIIFTGFVQVACGFESAFLTGIGVLGTGFIFGLVILTLMGALGFLPTEVAPNV